MELETKINEYLNITQNLKGPKINNSVSSWKPIVIIDHEKKTLEAVRNANMKPFLCKFHLASLFYRLLDDLKITSSQKLLLVIAFKLKLYEKDWSISNFIHLVSSNYRMQTNEFEEFNKLKTAYNTDGNINTYLNVNSNEIVDSQKTLFESSLKNDNVSMLSNEFQLPPSKLHKIISFLNKLNAFWGFDIFKEHQIAYSTNQIITTNGFAEKINDLLKNKFLKNGVVNRCDIIEAVGGQLTLDKLLYYKLKNINLTDSNKLDIYIQQQILLHNKNGNDKVDILKTTELYRIYETCHKLSKDPLFLFLKNSSLLELQPYHFFFKNLVPKEMNINKNDLSNQKILKQKIQDLLMEKLSYSIDKTNSIFQFYNSKISKEEQEKNITIFDIKQKKNQKSTSVSMKLIDKLNLSKFISNITNSKKKKAKRIIFEGIFYYLINNILPTKNKNNFYIKKRKIDDNSDDLTKWISPYFFNYCSDQENNDYEDILNNNKDSIVNYKIQLKVNKVLKPIIDQIYNKHQILSKYIPYSSLNSIVNELLNVKYYENEYYYTQINMNDQQHQSTYKCSCMVYIWNNTKLVCKHIVASYIYQFVTENLKKISVQDLEDFNFILKKQLIEFLQNYFKNRKSIRNTENEIRKRKKIHMINNVHRIKRRRMSLSLLNESNTMIYSNNKHNSNKLLNEDKISNEQKNKKINKDINITNMNDTDRRNLNNTKNSPLQNNESGSLDNNNNIKLINLKSKKIIKNVEETEKEENTQYDEKYISKKNEEEIKNEDIIRKLLTLRKIKKGYSILNDPSDINENKDVSTMRKDQNAMENSDEVILNKILNWKEIKTEGEIINKKSNSNDDRIEINENQKQLKRYTINNVSDIINKHFIDLEKIKKENEINEALKENFDNEMLIQNLFDWKKVKKEDEMSEEINSNEIENDDETKNKKIEFNNEILINDCFNWKIIKQENENREEENNKENLNNEFLLENFINWKEIKHENIIHEMKNEDKSEEGKKVLIKDLVDFKEIEMEKAMSKEENKKDKKGLKLSKEKEKYSNNNNDTFPKQEIKNKGKEKDFTFDSSLSRKNETISNLNDLYENSKLASPLLSTSTLPSSLSLTIKELNGNDSEEETLLSSHNFEEDYDKHFSIPIPQENNFPTLEDVEAASSSSNVITSTNSTSKISIIDEYNSDLSSVIPGTTKHDQKFLLLSSPSPSLSPSQSMDLIQLKKENTIQSPLIFSCSSDNEEKRGKKDLITLSDELPNQTIFNPEEIHLSSTFNELSPNMNSSSFVSNSFHSSPPSISSPNSKLSFSLPSYNNLPLFEDNMEQDFKDDINSKDLDQNKESIHHHYNNDEYDHLIIKSLTNTSLSNTNISDLLIADRNNSSNEPEEVCINNNNNKREMYSSNSENSKENNTTNATPEETYIYSKNMQSSSSPLKEFSDFIDEINNEEDSENEEKNQTFNQKDDIPQNKTKKKENNKSNPSTPSNDMNDQNYSIEDNFLLFIQDYLDQGDRVWEFV